MLIRGLRVQHHLKGPGAIHLLEKITPSSIAALQPGQSTLSCFLHPATGGMVDDIVISRPEYVAESNVFHIVSNAACREKDNAYITEQIARSEKSHGAISWEILSNQGLIALQGPSSPELLQNILRPKALGPGNRLNIDLKKLYFGQNKAAAVTGLPDGSQPEILISRGGYTGEDGFELSIPAAHTAAIAKHLLKTASPARLRLAGLAARDSLRLEAGMCLYGQDLDDSTTPVEAGLGWIVHADRRANGGFYGDGVILDQLRALKDGTGPSRRRVGLVIEGAPARTGAQILAYDATGDHASEPPRLSEKARDVVGMVTSGCPSPTLGQNIAMGYVQMGFHRANTELRVLVRGKERKAVVTKMPFVRSRYWKQPSGMAPG
jgi:aminomethyltransferase